MGPGATGSGIPAGWSVAVAPRTSSEFQQARYTSATQRPAAQCSFEPHVRPHAPQFCRWLREVHAGATARDLARPGARRRARGTPPSAVVQRSAPPQAVSHEPQCAAIALEVDARGAAGRRRRAEALAGVARLTRAAGVAAGAAVRRVGSRGRCSGRRRAVRSLEQVFSLLQAAAASRSRQGTRKRRVGVMVSPRSRRRPGASRGPCARAGGFRRCRRGSGRRGGCGPRRAA